METRLNHDSDRVELLEKQLREARELAAESDRKFEEVFNLLTLEQEEKPSSNIPFSKKLVNKGNIKK